MIEFNKVETIEAKLDTTMNRTNNQERKGHSYNEVGIVEGAKKKNVADESKNSFDFSSIFMSLL